MRLGKAEAFLEFYKSFYSIQILVARQLQFETSFENKKAAVETVTPVMDKDGI